MGECFLTDDIDDVQHSIPMLEQDRQRTPILILTAGTVGLIKTKRVYRVLFDTGLT